MYIHPHLNGLEPDFVLLNPKVGVAIYEVKDWDLDAIQYTVEFNSAGLPKLWAQDRNGRRFRPENPIEKAQLYRQEMLDIYCPRLREHALRGTAERAVTAGVIMTNATTQHVAISFGGLLTQDEQRPLPLRTPIVGRDYVENDNIRGVLPDAFLKSSMYMTEDLARDIRTWLVEPDHGIVQRTPLVLDERQQQFASTRTESGFRRIRGPAGAGKSLVLAARAVELASQGLDVLVVTFNITLTHYLQDLATRYPVPHRRRADRITWLNFHEWCRRACLLGDLGQEYHALWRRPRSESIFEVEVPKLADQALDEALDRRRYDAILVDEGQDFRLEWWNVLRKALRSGGEMLLVADETQDIYQRASRWTDAAMVGAGFSGPWATLSVSYRLPPSLVPRLLRYAEDFLGGGHLNLPEAAQGRLGSPALLQWIQVDSAGLVGAAVDAVLDLPGIADPELVAMSDSTLLAQSNEIGMECVNQLEALGIRCASTFGADDRSRGVGKRNFYMGTERVKATTIHSFKGWESRALVVVIERASTLTERREVFVALSRLKSEPDRPSLLTVVCAAPELAQFGKSFASE